MKGESEVVGCKDLVTLRIFLGILGLANLLISFFIFYTMPAPLFFVLLIAVVAKCAIVPSEVMYNPRQGQDYEFIG